MNLLEALRKRGARIVEFPAVEDYCPVPITGEAILASPEPPDFSDIDRDVYDGRIRIHRIEAPRPVCTYCGRRPPVREPCSQCEKEQG